MIDAVNLIKQVFTTNSSIYSNIKTRDEVYKSPQHDLACAIAEYCNGLVMARTDLAIDKGVVVYNCNQEKLNRLISMWSEEYIKIDSEASPSNSHTHCYVSKLPVVGTEYKLYFTTQDKSSKVYIGQARNTEILYKDNMYLTVTYDQDVTDNNVYVYGETVTILGTVGSSVWNTQSDKKGLSFMAGVKILIDRDLNLYKVR